MSYLCVIIQTCQEVVRKTKCGYNCFICLEPSYLYVGRMLCMLETVVGAFVFQVSRFDSDLF